MVDGTDVAEAQVVIPPTLAGQRSPEYAWPLLAGFGPVGALPTAPRLARAFTVLVLRGWGLSALVDTGELIVSEFTGNVTCAAAAPDGSPRCDREGRLPSMWLHLMSDLTRVRIEVCDNLPAALGLPAPRQAAPDEESGRGLELVGALSLDWGWETVTGHTAKRVWALIGT
jgi:hypothetical protein